MPSPVDLHDPEIEPRSPTLQVDSLPTEWGKALLSWRQWDDIKGLFKMNLLLLNIIKEIHAQVMTMIHLFRWFFHTSLSSNLVTSLSILSANEFTFLFQKEIIRREFTSVSTGKATHLPASLHIVLPPFCPSACSVFLLFKVNPATCAADPVYPHLQDGTSTIDRLLSLLHHLFLLLHWLIPNSMQTC